MIGKPRYETGGENGKFLGHYYKNDLYYDKETDMVSTYVSDYTGGSCKTFLLKRIVDPKDTFYPYKKALDLAVRFKLKIKENE